MTELWMVRAGERGYLIDDFIAKQIIAIGWNELGDLTEVTTLEQIKSMLRQAYPNAGDGQINMHASQIQRFRTEITAGQPVVTYNPGERVYWIGEVTSDYTFDPDLTDYHHLRRVRWERKRNRDELTPATRNSLGAISTIFRIPRDASAELLGHQKSAPEETAAEAVALDTIKEDVAERALEFIKDRIARLDWDELQELVAGILRAMGYKTLISPRGADRGKDIIASPDGLGLEDPKIIVEVKHRPNSAMGSQDVRNLMGVLRANDKALFVSTGGFTREAKYEAERANNPLTLVDLDRLVDLILQHYDNVDSETRTLLPLKKLYWPI